MSDIIQFGKYFTFGDIQSNSYGVWISGEGVYNAPEMDVEYVSIPGLSGDLVISNNRFHNIEIVYPAFISAQFSTRFDLFKAAMLSKFGYQRLTDTYHPDEYRLATFTGPIEVETGAYNRNGLFDITFNCKPQRFLVSGDTVLTFSSASGTITNPTLYASKPLIRVYGTGTVGIGSMNVTIATNPFAYIDIDSDSQSCFNSGSNAGQYVTMSGLAYPTLAAGDTGITKTSGITRVEITPRWWTV